MKFSSHNLLCAILVCIFLCPVMLVGQDVASPSLEAMKATQRSDYVSDASHIVGTYQPKSVKRDAESMAKAAKAFLESLTVAQSYEANLPLTDGERRQWTNLPAPANAGGIRMGDLNDDQVKQACQCLATLMSDHGYRKMRDIMLADDQLLRNGRARTGFGTENFSIVIFGEPSATKDWAFQIDGHHVGVNLAIKGDDITLSPSFIGTQPHKFKIGGIEITPFAHETDLAYKLLGSFNDDQVRAAVLSNRRGRIEAGPGTDGKTPRQRGMKCDKLDDAQKKILLELISQWVNDLPEAQAKARMEEIAGEISEMTISWNGRKKPGSDISYRIQSPSLIIEYACQDLGGNPVDHLHSMYRNPKNEYGGQLK